MEFQEVWQCHECYRILGPDDIGTVRDYPDSDARYGLDILNCRHCASTNVDRFAPLDLVRELARIRRGTKYCRGNLEFIQIILEGIFEL